MRRRPPEDDVARDQGGDETQDEGEEGGEQDRTPDLTLLRRHCAADLVGGLRRAHVVQND